MRPFCPGGEEGLSGGSPQDRLLCGPSLLSVGAWLLLNRGLAAPPPPPRGLQLVRWGDFWLFLPVSWGWLEAWVRFRSLCLKELSELWEGLYKGKIVPGSWG